MKYFTLRSFLLFLISLLNPERLVEGRSLKHPWINNFSLNSLSFVGDEGTFVPLPGNPSELKEITIKPKSLKLSREIRSLSQKAGQVSDENRRSEAVLVRMQALLPILHYLAGPVIQIRQFINWDKTIIISTVFYARPKNIWEVQDILRAATHVGLQARATGVGHTRSPLYVDEGNIMIDVKGLERHDGPRIEIHRPKPFKDYYILTGITGIIEEELNEYMKKNGVTMLAQPLNVKETLGGMAAVATHGSSWNEPTVSGYVVGMRIIDSRGHLRKFTEESNPELMKALKCNLGMMGIIYDISIKVYPAKKAKVVNSFIKLSELFLNKTALKVLAESHFETELSWYPFNSVTDAEANEYIKTSKVPSTWNINNDLIWIRTVDIIPNDNKVTLKGITFLPTKGSLSGSNVTGLLRGRAALKLPKNLDTVSYHYLLDAFPVLDIPKHGTETSAAFIMNIDKDFDRAARAIKFMVDATDKHIKKFGTTPLNAFLPRFVKNDNCYLCPANNYIKQHNDNGHSMVIDFLAPPTQNGFYETAEKFVHYFKNGKDRVRPHWAKRHDNIKGIVDIIHSSYGNNLELYMKQKQLSGLDPTGVFMNSYLNQIFCTRGLEKYCGYEV